MSEFHQTQKQDFAAKARTPSPASSRIASRPETAWDPVYRSDSDGNIKFWQFRPDYEALIQIPLLKLGSDYARWAVYHCLRKVMQTCSPVQQELPAEIAENRLLAFCRPAVEQLPKEFIAALHILGYQYSGSEKEGIFVLDKRLPLSPLIPPAPSDQPDIDKVVGTIREVSLTIPDERDPRIFQPHLGRGHSVHITAAAMEEEGLTDSRCVISYLEQYRKLIQQPTARNLFNATKHSEWGTGPFWSTMHYINNQGISLQFITLLHICFKVHHDTASSPGLITPNDPEEVTPLDQMLFQKLLERFCQDNY
jgi:hypothetical protein